MKLFTEIPRDLADDPWFKVVEMLQQNWAVIVEQDEAALLVFYGDTCGVFDQIAFDDRSSAEDALRRNGFRKLRDDPKAQEFIAVPEGEFHEQAHPNGFIYSSGRFWR